MKILKTIDSYYVDVDSLELKLTDRDNAHFQYFNGIGKVVSLTNICKWSGDYIVILSTPETLEISLRTTEKDEAIRFAAKHFLASKSNDAVIFDISSNTAYAFNRILSPINSRLYVLDSNDSTKENFSKVFTSRFFCDMFDLDHVDDTCVTNVINWLNSESSLLPANLEQPINYMNISRELLRLIIC